MATVKISDALRTSIRNTINHLFNKRIDALFNPLPVTAQEMYDVIFEEHIPIINNVPMAYLTMAPYFEVSFVFHGYRKEFRFDKQGGFKMPAAYKQATPAEFCMTRLYTYTASFGGEADTTAPRLAPVVAKLEPLFAEASRLHREREATQGTISNLLGTCGTLQQVHKVYPMILELCPTDTVAKFHEKVERNAKVKEAKEELEGVDLSALTGAVVASKIGGGA